MKIIKALTFSIITLTAISSLASDEVGDDVIAKQRAALAAAAAGYGPQSPRNINDLEGSNRRAFAEAPFYMEMNLCNIHFHKNAEHKGGEFTQYSGNGDGRGYGTGFRYTGKLSKNELTPIDAAIGDVGRGGLKPGDTIEVHYVYSTAQVSPGPTLGACLSNVIANPQLRVEAQVYVLVNDSSALDFVELTRHKVVNGLNQAINIPTNTGDPVIYNGSTTGPSYNEISSSLQVTWSVRPQVAKVNIMTMASWLEDNIFEENHAHGVRNLIVNQELLAPIQ